MSDKIEPVKKDEPVEDPNTCWITYQDNATGEWVRIPRDEYKEV